MRTTASIATLIGIASLALCPAQRNLHDIPDPDPQVQQASFRLADGFEVNLWASDPLLAKPTQISFDRAGRMWVSSSETYPQLNVNQPPGDRILILEDLDGNGTAETSSVFYDKLIIPGGVLPDGEGGCYVAHSEELLHLADTDGDGKADQETVLLSGFGSEDTHHTLHRLKWGPGGLLYMLQGYYIGTHVETLYGPRRLNGGGLWSYDTRTRQLEIYSRGLVNPWGLTFDRFGQTFQTDGAGGEGINYSFPDAVFKASPHEHRTLSGLNPGRPKLAGIEVISGAHFPEGWRGALLTNDFRANNIDRYVIAEKDSGYTSTLGDDLLQSTHISFRPIDLTMGPDGALYVADWYNPIIQHGEVDFRDKRRDQVHGRIWRITAKDRPLAKRPDYGKASLEELLEMLKADEDWMRLNAKQELKSRDHDTVISAIGKALNDADPQSPADEHFLLELVWAWRTASPNPLRQGAHGLAAAADHRVRAAAARMLYYWKGDLTPFEEAIADPHPRVRREAVTALGQYASQKAVEVAMRALDQPMDQYLDFALWRTCRLLEPHWLPAFQRGELSFGGNGEHLRFALKAVEKPEALAPLVAMLAEGKAKGDATLVALIGKVGTPEQLATLVTVAQDKGHPLYKPAVLALVEAAQNRSYKPDNANQAMAIAQQLLGDEGADALTVAGCRLATAWQIERLAATLGGKFLHTDTSPSVLQAAALALADLKQLEPLSKAASDATSTVPVRVAAALGMIQSDSHSRAAAALVARLMAEGALDEASLDLLIGATLNRRNAAKELSVEVIDRIIPEAMAIRATWRVETSGTEVPELVTALAKAGSLKPAPQTLTAAQIDALLAKVEKGDAERGKMVYQREALACTVCHAIGSTGGAIGPDLSSIGASAPADYLIESLLKPSKKIKEGYRMSMVTMKDGDVASGAVAREAANVLVLRGAFGTEVRVPKADIAKRETSPVSMMPPGLTASLREDEFVNLITYLTSLGKLE